METNGCQVIDEIYVFLGNLFLPSHTNQHEYIPRYYWISDDLPIIRILEDKTIISHGTTGLRTWEASLYLLDWLLANPNLIHDQCVLELGAGCGLLGLACAQWLNAKHVTMTDVNEHVLERLRQNMSLCHHSNTPCIEAMKLDWSDSQTWTTDYDVIIAADVVYDPDVIPALVNILQNILQKLRKTAVWIACLLRNESTLEKFVKQADNAGIHVTFSEVNGYDRKFSWWCELESATNSCRFRLMNLSWIEKGCHQ